MQAAHEPCLLQLAGSHSGMYQALQLANLTTLLTCVDFSHSMTENQLGSHPHQITPGVQPQC